MGSILGFIGAIWGLAGVSMILAKGVSGLYPYVTEALAMPLSWYHWLILIGYVLMMAYYEGYKGFQQGLAPRVAARARHLQANPEPLQILLSPIFCLGYFHSTTQRKVALIILTVMIFVLIQIVSLFPQPWRGIVDAGVVVGLGWGLVSLLYYGAVALSAKEFHHSPELPNSDELSVNASPINVGVQSSKS